MDLSVVICTHNPREDYLHKTLAALECQSLPRDRWELILIDNHSNKPLAEHWSLSWHPNARVIREEQLGLTHARLRGIREAKGDLLIFVDDDNVLDSCYLYEATAIGEKHPWIGAFGGEIEGHFETPVPPWALPFLSRLAIRSVDNNQWALLPGTDALRCAPCGAGMVVRAEIAMHYLKVVQDDPLRRALDRVGNSLSSAGDSDLALCSCSLGMAVGLFPQLKVTHLIPSFRLEQSYLLRLAKEMAKSHGILRFIWDGDAPEMTSEGQADRLLRIYKQLRERLRGNSSASFSADFETAIQRGIAEARLVINSLVHTSRFPAQSAHAIND